MFRLRLPPIFLPPALRIRVPAARRRRGGKQPICFCYFHSHKFTVKTRGKWTNTRRYKRCNTKLTIFTRNSTKSHLLKHNKSINLCTLKREDSFVRQLAQDGQTDVETTKKAIRKTCDRVESLLDSVYALTDDQTCPESKHYNPNVAICSAADLLACVETCMARIDAQIYTVENELIPLGYVKPSVKYSQDVKESKLPRAASTPAVKKIAEQIANPTELSPFSDATSGIMTAPGTPLALKLEASTPALAPISVPKATFQSPEIASIKPHTPAVPTSLRHGFTVKEHKDSPTLESIGLSQRALDILQGTSVNETNIIKNPLTRLFHRRQICRGHPWKLLPFQHNHLHE